MKFFIYFVPLTLWAIMLALTIAALAFAVHHDPLGWLFAIAAFFTCLFFLLSCDRSYDKLDRLQRK